MTKSVHLPFLHYLPFQTNLTLFLHIFKPTYYYFRLAVVYLLEELTLLAVAWRQQNLRANLGTQTSTTAISTSASHLALAPAQAVALALEQKAGTATEQVGVVILEPSLVVVFIHRKGQSLANNK